jgi:SAM-dependent methyltransferase
MSSSMICSDGTVLPLMVERWLGEAERVERALLEMVEGPVIDIGCGPGRYVEALAERGVPVLGIDVSGAAIELAERRDAPALARSVFDRLPGVGRWQTALLLDGNIGIGGHPVRLLARIKELLASGGRAIVEVDGPGVGCTRTQARILSDDLLTEPFPWALVGIDAIHDVTMTAGYAITELYPRGKRWFAHLVLRSST